MFPLTATERARHDIAESFEHYDLSENMGKMIATSVMPLHTVTLAHGTYPVLTLKELMRNLTTGGGNPEGYAARRAPRAAYPRDDLGFTSANYTTEEHGLEGTVDENEAAHYSSHFEHEAITGQWILHRLMVQRELRTARALFDTTRFLDTTQDTYDGQSQPAGTYRETATGNAVAGNAVPWSTYATADPIRDVFVAKSKVFSLFGMYPDALIMNEETWRYLRRNEVIRQQLMALGAGGLARQADLTREAVAMVLDVRDILVGSSVMDANNAATPSFQSQHIWGDGCLVAKLARGGSIREVALGHTLHWTADGSQLPAFVEDYYEPQTRTQVLRVRHQDRQLVKYNIAEFITTTL